MLQSFDPQLIRKILLTALVLYLFAVNLAGVLVMGCDKLRAVEKRWRISEFSLFLVSLLGGSLGTVLGMFFFRHKTRHWYFVLFMPLILFAHLAISAAVLYRFFL